MSTFHFDTDKTFIETLQQLQERKETVVVHVKGGGTHVGRIGGVGKDAIVLSELQGREFFDALIRTNNVSAIEVRVRGA